MLGELGKVVQRQDRNTSLCQLIVADVRRIKKVDNHLKASNNG
jgi:hypothetical protein